MQNWVGYSDPAAEVFLYETTVLPGSQLFYVPTLCASCKIMIS